MRVALPSLAGIGGGVTSGHHRSPLFQIRRTEIIQFGLGPKEDVMFDCLADQIRHDEHLQVSNKERYVRWFAVAVLSVVIFGGLYYGIQWLQ